LNLGDYYHRWDYAYVESRTYASLSAAVTEGADFAGFWANGSGILGMNVQTSAHGGNSIYLDYAAFYCYDHKGSDLGKSTKAWDTAYADDFTNVADFLHLDDRDDIALIKQIGGSGIIDKKTGLELIDDSTLPMELLARHKETGEVLYNPDGKPYIPLKNAISLLWGAVRQLDNKIGELRE
jgi:hypothetical protein